MEAVTEPLDQGAFSMELNEDQRDVRDWVHGFAANVVRPAAAEWDEREETPWPLIQEAAKIGLYCFEALAQFYADETGLLLPIVNEELFWGDAGIGMSIMGTTLAVAAIFSSGTRRAVRRVGAAVLRHASTSPQVGAFCVSEPDAGSRRVLAAHPRALRRGRGRVGLNGQKAWATNGGIANVHVIIASVDPELGSRGQAGVHHPARHARADEGTKVKKHGLRASHTADVFLDDCRDPRPLPARRQGEARRAPRPRPRGHARRRSRPRCRRSRPRARPSAPRRSASPAPPTSTRSPTRKERTQFGRADHREPGDRVRARRHAHGDRRRPAARLARVVDGPHGPQVRGTPRAR